MDLNCSLTRTDVDNKTPIDIARIYESFDVIDVIEGVAKQK